MLRGGQDILVEAEQIGRVVLGLERDQTVVVGVTVGGVQQCLAFFALSGEVEVGAAPRKGFHLGPRLACPGDRALVVGRVGPRGVEAVQVGCATLAQGSFRWVNPVHGAAQMPQRDQRPGVGPVVRVRDDAPDGVVVEGVEIERFPVILSFGLGEQRIEGGLHAVERNWPAEVEYGRTEVAQGLGQPLTVFERARMDGGGDDHGRALQFLGEVGVGRDAPEQKTRRYILGYTSTKYTTVPTPKAELLSTPSIINPAWAMDEKARNLLMFRCRMAKRFPIVTVRIIIAYTNGSQ